MKIGTQPKRSNLIVSSKIAGSINGFTVCKIQDWRFFDNRNCWHPRRGMYNLTVYLHFDGDIHSKEQDYRIDKAILTFRPPHDSHVPEQLGYAVVVFNICFSEDYFLKHRHLSDLILSVPFFKLAQISFNPLELDRSRAVDIATLCQKIYEEYQSGNPDQFELINSHFYTLLLLLKRMYYNLTDSTEHIASTKSGNKTMLVKKFISLLNNNYSFSGNQENLRSVSFYAQQLNIHPNYLNAIVKKEFGKTAHNFIMDHAINMSKLLLLQSDLSIKEIADKLVFHDVAHFSTVFKKYTNLPPSLFRATY